MIKIKRVYDVPSKADGRRILVERLWPRGIKKTELKLDAWVKEVAPSTELRKWFNHTPEKWKEFQRRYRVELLERPESWQSILASASKGTITLLYSSHDATHNNVVALKEFLEGKSRKKTLPKDSPIILQQLSQTSADTGHTQRGSRTKD